MDTLKEAPPPYESQNSVEEFRRDAKLAAWRKQIKEKYERQKNQGGIIDRLAEDTRFLVVTEAPPTQSASVESTSSSAEQVPQAPEASVPQFSTRHPSKYQRGHYRKPPSDFHHPNKNRFHSAHQDQPRSSTNPSTRGGRGVAHNADPAANPQPRSQPSKPRNRGPMNAPPAKSGPAERNREPASNVQSR